MSFSASQQFLICFTKIFYLIFIIGTMLFFFHTIINEKGKYPFPVEFKYVEKLCDDGKDKKSFDFLWNRNYSDYGLALFLGLFISIKKLRNLGTV